jgi:hypothetical protein
LEHTAPMLMDTYVRTCARVGVGGDVWVRPKAVRASRKTNRLTVQENRSVRNDDD